MTHSGRPVYWPHTRDRGEGRIERCGRGARALGKRVLSMDNALFLDGLRPEQQPGIHVRRIGGALAVNDEEQADFWKKTIGKNRIGDTRIKIVFETDALRKENLI